MARTIGPVTATSASWKVMARACAPAAEPSAPPQVPEHRLPPLYAGLAIARQEHGHMNRDAVRPVIDNFKRVRVRGWHGGHR